MISNTTTQFRMPQYTSLDLFAGAGGFSTGLLAAGFSSVGAVEIDKAAGCSYSRNFSDCKIQMLGPSVGDLTKISPNQFAVQLSNIGLSEIDLLVAGPPCQGFSRVGRGKLASLRDTEHAFLYDPRNQLYRAAIELLKVLKPRAFLFENVAGILHLHGNNMAEAVCRAVSQCGYTVRCALLNSGWYGVPQTRERVFIVGYRNDLGIRPEFPPITHAVELSRGHLSNAELDPKNWRDYNFFVPFNKIDMATNLKPAVTVGDALADLPPFTKHLMQTGSYRSLRNLHEPVEYASDPPNEYCQLMRNWSGRFISPMVTDHYCRNTPRDFETFALMQPGDRYPEAHSVAEGRYRLAVKKWKQQRHSRPRRASFVPPYSLDGFPDKWRKLMQNQPSWTITAHLGKDTYSHIHYDSSQKRTITVREAARLQSFPDGFHFEGNTGSVLHQIGNAVPPLLAKAIADVIHRQLSEVDLQRPGWREPSCMFTVSPL